MRGKGVSKMGSFFVFFLFVALVSKLACFVLLKKMKTYGFNFGFLSFVVWISVGESLWTSWASRDILEWPLLSKIVKNLMFFLCFFENAAFGFFDAFDGCFESFVSLFGRFSSTMDSKMGFEKVPNSDQALNKKSA